MFDVALYRRVLGYLKPYRRLVVAAFFATLAFAALDAFTVVSVIPLLNALFDQPPLTLGTSNERLEWLLRNTIGRVTDSGLSDTQLLLFINLFILVVFFLKNIFEFLQQYLVVKLEQVVTRDLRNETYGHVLDMDMKFFGRTRAGQVITRITSDADLLRTLLTKNLIKLFTSSLQIIITVGLLLAMSVKLTLIAIVVLPIMFGVWSRFLKRLKRGDRRVLNLGGEVMAHVQETVSGIRLVKASGSERFEASRFRQLTGDYMKAHIRTERLRALASPLTEMIGALGTIALLYYGAQLVVENEIVPAVFFGFLGLSLKLYTPAKWLTKYPSMAQPGLVAAERIFELIDAPVDIADQPDARKFEAPRRSIRFENVSFAYDLDAQVLTDVDFEVPVGSVVALVGPSGAGKTTLVDLLARFYDPTDGRITIDDVDLREYSIRSLRSKMGIVSQDTVLFHDTVRANIAYGRPDVPLELVERAARMANAHEFIVQLPEGYDTVLGERGTRLSGGQRQRLAIARAVLRDPPILIFDEATSALDSESERLVQQATEQLLEGRTVFIIAHRLSTVRRADQILVLRDGRIVERGRHEDLLERGGQYRRLYDLQIAAG